MMKSSKVRALNIDEIKAVSGGSGPHFWIEINGNEYKEDCAGGDEPSADSSTYEWSCPQ